MHNCTAFQKDFSQDRKHTLPLPSKTRCKNTPEERQLNDE